MITTSRFPGPCLFKHFPCLFDARCPWGHNVFEAQWRLKSREDRPLDGDERHFQDRWFRPDREAEISFHPLGELPIVLGREPIVGVVPWVVWITRNSVEREFIGEQRGE